MKTLLKLGVVVTSTLMLQSNINAQSAQHLDFTPPSDIFENEFGSEVLEFAGHSIFGTDFDKTINVFKNGQFLFQTTKGSSKSQFGNGLGMNSNWLAVGAPQDSLSSSLPKAGAVYLSQNVNGQAADAFNQKIIAQTPVDGDRFGDEIAIHNNWMAISAPGGDYIEMWQESGSSWVRKQKISFNDGNQFNVNFGPAVAVRGNYLVVGTPNNGKVYLFKYVNNFWTEVDTYIATPSWYNGTSELGQDVDMTDGFVIAGDPAAEKVAIFSITNDKLVLSHTLTPPTGGGGSFGESVAIQYNRAVVGAPTFYEVINGEFQGGRVYLFSEGYQLKGHMNLDPPSGLTVNDIGRSVSINQDNVLAGGRYSNQVGVNRNNIGSVHRQPFWYVYLNSSKKGDSFGLESEVTLSPNPAAGNTLQISTEEELISVIAVSTLGNVYTLSIEGIEADITNLPAGLYQVSIVTSGGTTTSKFIKQ